MKEAKEMGDTELLSELVVMRARRDTPGYFAQFGFDSENVKQAVLWRIEDLERELSARRKEG